MADTKNTKGKSTVRSRKKRESSAVQNFLPIAEIHDSTMVLKNGGLRAVLSVGSINFSLKSEDEQRAIIYSYQQFLNTIEFPVQMVVRSTKLNVDAYISDVQERSKKQENPLLREQTRDYARFIERLVDVSEIMHKSFYCVVPVDPPGITKTSFLGKIFDWLSPGDTRNKALIRKGRFEEMSTTLKDRVNMVKVGLEGVGISAERLGTSQLIELFYSVYNPKTSQEQKLHKMGNLNVKDYVL